MLDHSEKFPNLISFFHHSAIKAYYFVQPLARELQSFIVCNLLWNLIIKPILMVHYDITKDNDLLVDHCSFSVIFSTPCIRTQRNAEKLTLSAAILAASSMVLRSRISYNTKNSNCYNVCQKPISVMGNIPLSIHHSVFHIQYANIPLDWDWFKYARKFEYKKHASSGEQTNTVEC